MSVCGQSGQTEDESGSEDVTAAGAAVRELHKQKPVSKVVRVLTVLAYLLSVSLAAILLSVYYVCVWRSPELPRLNDTAELGARRDAPPAQRLRAPDHHALPPLPVEPPLRAGGGDSGVRPPAGPEDSNTVPTSVSSEETTDPLDSLESTTEFTELFNSTFGSSTNATDVT